MKIRSMGIRGGRGEIRWIVHDNNNSEGEEGGGGGRGGRLAATQTVPD
jgi:hypothetical protein